MKVKVNYVDELLAHKSKKELLAMIKRQDDTIEYLEQQLKRWKD